MPKKASGPKARWTAAQKAQARKGPKKPHRGQGETRPPARSTRPDGRDAAPGGKRPRSERSPRWDREDPRRSGRDDRRRSGDAPRQEDRRRDDRRRDDRGWEDRRRDDRRDHRVRSGDERRRDDRGWEDRRRDDRRRDDHRGHRPHEPRPRRERGERPVREPHPRVADPVRRDRHEGRHAEHPVSFEEAEALRAEADTWTRYSSTAGGPKDVTADNGFAALGLSDRLVERLARDGITDPFPIQVAAIPDALAGRDVLGRGRTGSGKTLAFGLPLVSRLADGTKPASRRPRALVLVPTRELAMQVSDALEPFVHVTGLRHRLVAGGLSYEPQISSLAKGVHLLVATPGRLADLMERGAVELDDVEVAVLDEADHMADMGFLPEVTAILDALPAGGQRLLFSATLDRGVDDLVARYLVDPVTHSTDEAQAAVTTMSHHVLLIDPQEKKALTAELAGREGRVIVFARTQLGADRIAGELRAKGVLAASLHGGLTQAIRNRVLGAFRDGRVSVLVATDVAARGIHVDDVGLVVQVDPPRDHKDYLHRAGRTARAGERGAVVMLALPHQRTMVTRIIEGAGADAITARVSPGDATMKVLGGRAPSGVPVPDEVWRPILEPKRSERRGGRPGRGGGPRQGNRHGAPSGRGRRGAGRGGYQEGRMGA
jgi:superfamily II DNA/RNA helicase